jgi:hypothetical protein
MLRCLTSSDSTKACISSTNIMILVFIPQLQGFETPALCLVDRA